MRNGKCDSEREEEGKLSGGWKLGVGNGTGGGGSYGHSTGGLNLGGPTF